MKKVYLCGPMTIMGDGLNRDAFEKAAAHLCELYHVFNPADNPPHLAYQECMRRDLAAVLDADAVVVLPRWDEGTGTRVEVAVALAVGIPVLSWPGMKVLYPKNSGRSALSAFVGTWARGHISGGNA